MVESNASGTLSTTEYTYDELGRLTREQFDGPAGTDYTTEYTLDLVGNRLVKQTTLTSGDVQQFVSQYNTPGHGLLTETMTLDGLGRIWTTYIYDPTGASPSKAGPGETATYRWNPAAGWQGPPSTERRAATRPHRTAYRYNDEGIRTQSTESRTI